MTVYKIINAGSNRYLSSGADTWSELKNSPYATMKDFDNSPSMLWYLDASVYYQAKHIRAALDVNYGTAVFSNTYYGRCGITNISYYKYMPNNPYNPEIVFDYVGAGLCKIKLADYNAHLCDRPNVGPCWADPIDNIDEKYLLWNFSTVSGYNGCSLVMPQNMNQYFDGYDKIVNSACKSFCFADVVAYYTGKPYTYADMLNDGVMKEKSDLLWKSEDVHGCTITSETKSTTAAYYQTIKTEIDEGRPVLVRIGDSNKEKHYVVAYGYNGTVSASTLFVLDPANSKNASQNIGKYCTLQDSMKTEDAYKIWKICVSSYKNSTNT